MVRTDKPPQVISLDEAQAFNQHRRATEDAAEWNSLLLWARKIRGPQWDFSTAQYMVDKNSVERYSGVELEAPSKEPTPPANQDNAPHLAQNPHQQLSGSHGPAGSYSNTLSSSQQEQQHQQQMQMQMQMQMQNAQMAQQQHARNYAQTPQMQASQASQAQQFAQLQASLAQQQAQGVPFTPQQIAYYQQQDMLYRRAMQQQQQQQQAAMEGSG